MIKQQVIHCESISSFLTEYNQKGFAVDIISLQPFAFVEDEMDRYNTQGEIISTVKCKKVEAFLMVYAVRDMKKIQEMQDRNILIPNLKMQS